MIIKIRWVLLGCYMALLPLYGMDYTTKPEVKKFIKMMHHRYGFKTKTLERWLGSVRKQTRYLNSRRYRYYWGQSHSKGSWDRYAYAYLKRTPAGVYFMRKFHDTLKRASKKYGVPPEYITAIIGVETDFGVTRGDYYVFDRLVHLAFDKDSRRAKFYQKELIALLRLVAKEKINPKDIRGSASGAIGLAQFMPSTYKLFGVDFNHDGKIRMNNVSDAIGSIAYYFRRHHWHRGEDVAVRARYEGNRFNALETGIKKRYDQKALAKEGIEPREPFNYKGKVYLIKLERHYYDELWYGGWNFYVITRYNHSSYYAMSVHQLAQRIKKTYQQRYGKF